MEPDLHPYHEQEQDQANLAQGVERAYCVTGKQMRKRRRRHPAQKRRPKQNTGRHFSHYPRLTNAVEHDAEQARSCKHRTDLKKE
jgi:hypothetical protein